MLTVTPRVAEVVVVVVAVVVVVVMVVVVVVVILKCCFRLVPVSVGSILHGEQVGRYGKSIVIMCFD